MDPATPRFTLPPVRRVPLVIVFLSIPAVVGLTWWKGTRDYDFLKAPSATEIETAKVRATAELARPADLFAIEQARNDPPPTDLPVPKEAPLKRKPKPPRIDVSDPGSEPPLDAWTERGDLPAASFIELASRLESDGHLAWARVTWERVIDLAGADRQDLEIAVRGIARIRASMPPPDEVAEEAPEVRLVVGTPADRIELTRRAAAEAAEALALASDRTIRFATAVNPDPAENAPLRVELRPPGLGKETAPSVSSAAPSDPDQIRRTILSSCFKLIASSLATSDELAPLSPPTTDEAPLDSLSNRITRRAWRAYVREN